MPDFFDEQRLISAESDAPRKFITKAQAISSIHEILRDAKLNITFLLLDILETAAGDGPVSLPGKAFYRDTNAANIHRLLDLILENKKGSKIMKKWMYPHAVSLVCETIHTEMEAAKKYLFMTTAQTSPEFIETWDINAIMDPISQDITPTWTSVLQAATESRFSQCKKSDKPDLFRKTTQHIISTQVHYRRSSCSAKVQIGLGLMAWSTGASKNLINVLHKAGLSKSYTSIGKTISSLHKFSIEQAREISRGPHVSTYDNINIPSSDRLEQCPDAMAKMQIGTLPTLYALDNVDPNHLKLAPILENLKKACSLKLGDLRPSKDAAMAYLFQTSVNIVKVLFKYSNSENLSDALVNHPDLQHKPRRPLPKNHKTRCFPLAISTIEEASVVGNLHLTNSRIRSCQILRAKDVNSWERREVFQLAFGTFHMVMNLIWALLHMHRGSLSQHGSLAYYFAVLEKARLGKDRPEYYPLLAALTQVIDGLIVNSWRSECGYHSLDAFLQSNPSPEEILSIAQIIVKKYATPKASVNPTGSSTPYVDHVHSNTILLIRDLLYVIELVSAISAGDFGRIEDILPDLACIFRGAGSNNYSMEILHFIFNLKYVWTDDFAYVNSTSLTFPK
ncbi:hypothetical protein BDN70DRAFT_821376 [Pholiota conissans]|uniref:DUF6589 domain-containing protein n=1 Tax=Pholiota conissans TaxID=109636 RepID=A0A9P5YKS5_9AGAR|nr:hypothetical protein BDN70DRAFT_821376 [Pholiota conissans]